MSWVILAFVLNRWHNLNIWWS